MPRQYSSCCGDDRGAARPGIRQRRQQPPVGADPERVQARHRIRRVRGGAGGELEEQLAPLRAARRSEAQQLQLLLRSPGARAAAVRDSDGEGGGPLGEPHRETRAVWLVGRRPSGASERACQSGAPSPTRAARGITDQAAALAAAGGLRQRRSEHGPRMQRGARAGRQPDRRRRRARTGCAARVAASWPSAGD